MSRRDIYYWKCDRPAAFHGTQARDGAAVTEVPIEAPLLAALCEHFGTSAITLAPGAGQGNHLTWNADVDGQPLFIRVENGPEQDGQLAVESSLLDQVRALGVPTPRVFGVDATRSRVPFAWQALERIDAPDLNHWQKQGTLDVPRIAFDIGAAVATWQQLTFPGFGPLHGDAALQGWHARYADYHWLQLQRHLDFLVARQFLTDAQGRELLAAIKDHGDLLSLDTGVFVHKDLALWNVLGSTNRIAAFIDFDDAISGDAMDDLSLLACFHDPAFVQHAFEGYQSLRSLPADALPRFWLHLMRNMIVKSVIRVGAGYFERDSGFFLIGANASGASLREFTLARLMTSLHGLRDASPLDALSMP